jgi:DNA-binding CsgD family transcriptional regulator
MPELHTSQLRGALEALSLLAGVDELEEFPLRVAEAMRTVVPCHHAGYTVVELGTDRVQVVADPPETVFAGGPEIFARFAHQNPLLSDLAASGSPRAGRLSDYLSPRELHRTELYDHVYRHIPLEYQMGVPLRSPRRDLGRPGELAGLSLVRVERDFSDGEKLLLELMRPQLAAMLTRLHERELLRATEAADAGAGRWSMLLDASGTPVWTSDTAGNDLDLRPGEPLPAALLDWVRRQPHIEERGGPWGEPLSLDGVLLQPRLVRDAYPGLDGLHLRPLRPRPTLAGLRALGLTARQAEVMQLALGGRTSRQIGGALWISPRTVEKHMEGIYARLGAANRTEAVLIAARALDP